MRAWVIGLAFAACAPSAASSEGPLGAPRPSCPEAERYRVLACDLAKQLCDLAEKQRADANVARCADGRSRCAVAVGKVADACEQNVSQPPTSA
jgi:hypothetical protein